MNSAAGSARKPMNARFSEGYVSPERTSRLKWESAHYRYWRPVLKLHSVTGRRSAFFVSERICRTKLELISGKFLNEASWSIKNGPRRASNASAKTERTRIQGLVPIKKSILPGIDFCDAPTSLSRRPVSLPTAQPELSLCRSIGFGQFPRTSFLDAMGVSLRGVSSHHEETAPLSSSPSR